MRLVLRFLAVVAVSSLVAAGTVVALAPQAEELFSAGRSQESEIDLDPLCERSVIRASDGTVLAVLHGEVNRRTVPLEEVPEVMVEAVLAVEDREFWSHNGVNLRATLRALIENVDEGSIAQGGSTITQQLVKQTLVGTEQSLDRKSREAFLALRLEEQMSKEEILDRYINTVYFGQGAYGVQAAAETYFGISATEITLGEAALLAALIRNPRDYDPFAHPDRAKERRDLALDQLEDLGHITSDERLYVENAPLPAEQAPAFATPDDYFVEAVKQALLDDERLGRTEAARYNTVFCGGIDVTSTMDLRAQFLAVSARDEVIAPFGDPGVPGTFPLPADPITGEPRFGTAAVASIDPSTGAVRAIVGGPGFDQHKYNLATQGARQPGSSFKGLVLFTLLDEGYVPSDTVSGRGPCSFDVPGLLEPYDAQNFGNSRGFTGSITSQTLNSSNCAFLRLGQIAGLDNVVEMARDLGITTPLDPNIFSMPLGSMEVKPIEMAAAYGVAFSDGVRNPTYLIDRVLDRQGEVVFEHTPAPTQVLDQQEARLAAEVLRRNITSGTGTRARIDGWDAGGKTGTAQNFGDAWFVGGTKELATAVWMGSPVGRVAMSSVGGRSVTGGSWPAEIWGEYMNAYHEGLEPVPFDDPEPTRSGRYLRVERNVEERSSVRRRSRSRSRSSGPGTSATTTTVADPTSTTEPGPGASTPTTASPSPTTSPPSTTPPATAPPSTTPPRGGEESPTP